MRKKNDCEARDLNKPVFCSIGRQRIIARSFILGMCAMPPCLCTRVCVVVVFE